MKNMVMNTLSEIVLTDIENKLDELGVTIVEERYNLTYHRYEIYIKVNLRQKHAIRKFVKHRDVRIFEV